MRVVPPLALIIPVARFAAAQCPNGTPPPCSISIAPTPDPGRIAVFPFHVTTADSLLGEGVAELVAGELTGEGGPRAVHMGTTLRTWRRAGGGLRTPLDHAAEMRAARDLGAGLVVEGSVIGLGQQLTLSAQVVSVPSGTVRRATPVSGLPDSLPRLIEQLAAEVLTASGASRRDVPQRLSDSPAAVRAYIEGLAAYRRGRFAQAADAFEQAIRLDTLFTRASFMRWLVSTWGAGIGTDAARQAARQARSRRASLSPDDQIVLDAAFGDLPAKERAAAAAPDSPEALYFLADWLFHHAPGLGWDSSLARARVVFEQSVALDSQATVLHHLVEIGLWLHDSTLMRRAWTGYDRVAQGTDPSFGWLVADRIGDSRLTSELRRRAVPVGTEDDFFRSSYWYIAASRFLPPATIEELSARTARGAVPRLQPIVKLMHFYAVSLQGRPKAAADIAAGGISPDVPLLAGFSTDLWAAASGLVGDGPAAIGAAAAARLRATRLEDPDAQARTTCMVRLWDATTRDAVVPDDGLLRDHGQAACAAILDVLSASSSDRRARLERADSVVQHSTDPAFGSSGIGEVIVAQQWEAVGDPGRALALLRSRIIDFPNWSAAASYRAEARLAALTGDTTGAIRVYRQYLSLRQYAEASFIPQRDSVAAELARLETPKR